MLKNNIPELAKICLENAIDTANAVVDAVNTISNLLPTYLHQSMLHHYH